MRAVALVFAQTGNCLIRNMRTMLSRKQSNFRLARWCKMSQNRIGWKPNFVLPWKPRVRVARFSYLGSCISPGGCMSDEAHSLVQSARFALNSLKHLGLWRDKRLANSLLFCCCWEVFLCLNFVFSALFGKIFRRISSVTQLLSLMYWVPAFSL